MAEPAGNPAGSGWPALRVRDWAATKETLHLWTQIVGKIRMAHAPMLNHWWQVTLYVTPRGLTTSSIPYGHDAFDMEFDFCEHVLRLRTSNGTGATVDLSPKPVAEFHAETFDALGRLGIKTAIRAVPNEVEDAIPFAEDYRHTSYDGEAARMFWQQLIQADRLLKVFRSYFRGKVSPCISSGEAWTWPAHGSPAAGAHPPGRRPELRGLGHGRGLLPRSQQLRFLARRRGRGCVLCLRVPGTGRIHPAPGGPADAAYDQESGLYLLPYEAVRRAADPDRQCFSSCTPLTPQQLRPGTGTAPRSKPIRTGGRSGSPVTPEPPGLASRPRPGRRKVGLVPQACIPARRRPWAISAPASMFRFRPAGPAALNAKPAAAGGCTCGGAPSAATSDAATIHPPNTPPPTPAQPGTRSSAASSRARTGSGTTAAPPILTVRNWHLRHIIRLSQTAPGPASRVPADWEEQLH